jgi:hypothetical protein
LIPLRVRPTWVTLTPHCRRRNGCARVRQAALAAVDDLRRRIHAGEADPEGVDDVLQTALRTPLSGSVICILAVPRSQFYKGAPDNVRVCRTLSRAEVQADSSAAA